MCKRFGISIFLLTCFLVVLIAPQAGAECEESWALVNKLKAAGMVMEVRNGFREWLVTKNWYSLSLPIKEETVNVFAAIRKKCNDGAYIKVRDGYSGDKVAEYGFTGVKIFK